MLDRDLLLEQFQHVHQYLLGNLFGMGIGAQPGIEAAFGQMLHQSDELRGLQPFEGLVDQAAGQV